MLDTHVWKSHTLVKIDLIIHLNCMHAFSTMQTSKPIGFLVGLLLTLCQHGKGYDYPFQNPDLPWNDRVDDLVKRLTIEEISKQSVTLYYVEPPSIPRLGIKPYMWITECLHGHFKAFGTAFPQSLGLSSTFSRGLIFDVATAISKEVRATNNYWKSKGRTKTFNGLTCFSPLINIMRHPLWGRNQETWGEDPYLVGQLSQPYVRGLQGDHPRYVRVTSTCKHMDGYGGPDNFPITRYQFSANISTTDWRMTFLPAFKACVEAKPLGVMCSYNSINGIPSCANGGMLNGILRKEFGFTGYITSDNHATGFIMTQHNYTKTVVETAQAAIRAGVNLEIETKNPILWHIVDAYKQGALTEHEIRDSVKHLFYIRMRQGEFDPSSMNPYTSLNLSVVQSPEHRDLALKAAMMSFVLLKNVDKTLPIKKKVQQLALVGSFANRIDWMYASYAPIIQEIFATTLYEGLIGRLSATTKMEPVCNDVFCENYSFSTIKNTIKGADLIILALGLSITFEDESRDRKHLDFPGRQMDILLDVVANANGAKVVVLLFNGGPINISWLKYHPGVHAILECFYPAQATGEAVYRVLTASGPHSVPAGRLTATWPVYLNQVNGITNYTMMGNTYRYFRSDPLYPFGYGLSYSSFKYIDLELSPKVVQPGDSVKVKVTVANLGPYDADEVVQLYISWLNATVPAPKIQLVGFERVPLAVGTKSTVKFTLTREQIEVWVEAKNGTTIPSDEIAVYVGGQQPYQTTRTDSNILKDILTVSRYKNEFSED